MSFTSLEPFRQASSSSCGLDSPHEGEADDLTDRPDVVRHLQWVLRARQRQLWITFGRLLSYLGHPVACVPRRCFHGYVDCGQHHMDHQRPVNGSRASSRVKIGPQEHDDELRPKMSSEGQLSGLSALAHAAEMATGEEDPREGRVRGMGRTNLNSESGYRGAKGPL